MKKILFYVGVLVFTGFAFMYTHYNHPYSQNQCIVGRGCCSGHGGVCGCKNGHSQCCDGTQSPSCQCFRDDITGSEM